MSTALVAAGVWFVRMPLAEFMIGQALSERGTEADLQVVNLDLERITLSEFRIGAADAPDVEITEIEARWEWRGLMPRLLSVRIVQPHVRLRLDQQGHVSAGALDRFEADSGPARRPSIPRLALEIIDGAAEIEAPFGALNATFESSGTIGEDFTAAARIADTTQSQGNYALTRGAAELVIVSRDETIAFRLNAALSDLTWADARAQNVSLRALGRAPLDLARINVEGAWRAGALNTDTFAGETLTGALSLHSAMRDDALEFAQWNVQTGATAASLRVDANALAQTRLDLRADGDGPSGTARWTVVADGLDAFGIVSNESDLAGTLTFDIANEITYGGEARLRLQQARLSNDAQQGIRDAFPNLGGSPLGPTFASAEAALDRAVDAFTFTAPLTISSDAGNPRFVIAAPIEARAASGLSARLASLRQDAPALLLQWPGPTLSGAVELQLSGGGAPNAALLLDTITWSPEAPFEADGTLTLANWRAENASIAAEEIGITIASGQGGGGSVELRGPVQITGPLGDGEVRELTPNLNVTIAWGDGWRVLPSNGCLPTRMGGLDAAGLSFANGEFALCALNGALIAADTNGNLSGGFSIRSLALNGRMAGEAAQPARVTAGNVVGRFSGRTGDMTLALTANSPRLTIEMAEDRTLALVMASLTANAHIADSWRMEGEFAEGVLTDPALPGTLSTIAGGWSAAPENDKPVIRVAAGEALLTANAPPTENDRALFNPLRLADMNAVLADGQINAQGAIVLDASRQQLARFEAQHDVDQGVGAARINAERISFGPSLQPYDITEQARGMVESVTGDAIVTADIDWTRDAIVGVGRAKLENVSLATATIPVVNDVNGEIYFDDLFTLTTPPGQFLRVGLLNPGVAVRNGRVRFQLLPEQLVAIEQAEFDFAAGTLAMAPTRVTLGSEETRFELTLRDVDATELVTALNVPDLQATGRIEGSFPLRLTRVSAFVEGGVLRAAPGGGVISYTGNAGDAATGPSKLAFDALRSFRYDDLGLTLDGDLNGDVISSITFSGRNSGEPVDLGEVAPIPGLGRVTVRGVPFDFNVTVTAPFRRLAQTAASIADPGSLIRQAEEQEEEPAPPEEVDPGAPGTD
ncbi:intermembrane phospholipid transport protein YdbH family protein [Vitreimonas flagellata]|uniref:intermembrane phospholipid transport protein YdbH family protein n=1 Tax=Vitreimonas flagellata TaxID=2560861 RepID=UPI001431CC22|nr:YdbH domain-containing protein [Vitreimonas flagellata]